MSDMEAIRQFEEEVARYAGSEYGVAVDSCTNAIFLSLQYLKSVGELHDGDVITLPSHTFLSVPCQLKHSGLRIQFCDIKWSGIYQLKPSRVYDCATRFTEDMFVGGNALQCLSFQARKHLPIGRGGMVLTNDFNAVRWLRMARINGRHEGVPRDLDELEVCGWNMYLMAEQASRGLTLLGWIPKKNADCGSSDAYADISKMKVFQ